MKKISAVFWVCLLFASSLILSAAEKPYKAPSPEILPNIIKPIKISKSKWIWCSDAPNAADTKCFYRYELNIYSGVKSAELVGYLDDDGRVYCNGKAIARKRVNEPRKQVMAGRYDITGELKQGKNIIAVKAENERHYGGAFFLGKIVFDNNKEIYIHTNKKWKATTKEYKGFHLPEFNDSAWPAAVEFGDAAAAPWFDVSNITHTGTTEAEKRKLKRYMDRYLRAPAAMASEPQRSLKIVWKNDRPAFSDGQKEYPPEIFRFHLPGGLDMTKESDIALKISQTGYHILEVGISSKQIERSPGVYDFTGLENSVGMLLRTVPDASIIIQIRIDELNKFLRENPDDGIGYATGPADNKRSKIWHSVDVGGRKIAPSYASKKFQQELRNFVLNFIKYAKQQPWCKRMVGLRITNGCYSEWHYFGMAGQMPDTGKAMTLAFREFAREKYKTVEALRKAWHDEQVTFETVTVPGVEERWGKKRFLRDSGSVDRKVMDYYICHQQMIADSLLTAAQAAKEAMPHLLIGTYYGYVFGMAQFPSEGQTLFLEKVLSSPYIDFLSSPYCYDRKSRFTGGDGLLRMIPSTFVRYRKLAINEEDTRTHLMPEPKNLTNVKNAHESAQIFLRDYALHSLQGVGDQLVDFGAFRAGKRTWFNDPDILTAIHIGHKNYLKIRDAVKSQPNKIGVIYNIRELYLHSHPVVRTQQFNIMLADGQVHALNFSGYPYDLMTLEDFLATEKKYDTLVFLNAFTITDQERAVIKKRLTDDKSSAIWIYAPGLVTENKWSEDAMKELTGINLKVKDAILPMALNCGKLGTIGNAKVSESPRIYVDDPEALTMGHFSDKTVGMARKNNVIFSAVPINNPEVWANLFKESGEHAYTDPGIFIYAVNPFVLVHVAKAGDYPIYLPAKAAKVVSVYENDKVLGENTDKVILKSSGCKTWLLKVQ